MSIDIMIIPRGELTITPRRLISTWAELLEPSDRALLGDDAALVQVSAEPERSPWPADRVIERELFYACWLEVPNTLSFGAAETATTFEEDEYVADVGRNLSDSERQHVIDAWRRAGYFLEITSYAGRGPRELSLASALARAAAELTEGWVGIEGGGILAPAVGIYTPDALARIPLQLK